MMSLIQQLVELEESPPWELIDIEAFLLRCGYQAVEDEESKDLVMYVHPVWRGGCGRLVFVRSHRFIPTAYVRDTLRCIRGHIETGPGHEEGG
jgi:hypothetical protein